MAKLQVLMDFLQGKKRTSASIAKERLQIIISHEHTANKRRDINLSQLKQELLQVVAKYIKIDEEQISIQIDNDNNMSILELSIALPDSAMVPNKKL